jgi:hypothetical protein
MAHAKKESQDEDGKSSDHRQPARSHAAAAAGSNQDSRERPGKRAILTPGRAVVDVREVKAADALETAARLAESKLRKK